MMKTFQKGVTLLEILIVIAILGALSALIVGNFSSTRGDQVLKNETEAVVALLQEARSNTLSGLDSSQYGVHIQSDRVILFKGSSYSSSDPSNSPYFIDDAVFISSINLQGGGSDIIFERLTGETTAYGTLILRRASDASLNRTITISSIGLASSN